MRQFNATIIIPTIGRRQMLARLLASIRAQSIRFSEMIIVNGGREDIGVVVDDYANLSVKCVNVWPPSLTRQRNVGIGAASNGSDFIGFFDDDIVLQKGSLEAMADFWDGADECVGGASFNIISDNFKPATALERFFQVNACEGGRVLKSGFNSKVCSVERTKEVDWLLGGATIWRRAVIDAYRFDEWFAGYAHCEDVEYSYRVGKKYRLMVVSDAHVAHFSDPNAAISQEHGLGKMQVVNRLHFVSLNQELSLLACYWACIGLLLNNLVKGTVRDRRYLNRACGNLVGLVLFITRKSKPMIETIKSDA